MPHRTDRRRIPDLLVRAPSGVAEAERGAWVAQLVDPTAQVAQLDDLRRRGVHRVFVEGGPAVAASFVRAGLADEFLVYIAPALIGGDMLALRDVGVTTIGEARRLRVREIEKLGDDLLVVAAPATEGVS